MKKTDTSLAVLWIAAALVGIAGISANILSLAELGRQTELWRRKTTERRELESLRLRALRLHRAAQLHREWPPHPLALQELARTNLPGMFPASCVVSAQPAPEGWQAQRTTCSLVDVPGDSLLRFLAATGSTKPPWVLEECAMQSSPISGRLARVDMTFSSVERAGTGD